MTNDYQGRTPAQQQANEDAAEIVNKAILVLVIVGLLAFAAGVMAGGV